MFTLNPALDPKALGGALALDRRLQVRDFFTAEDAERIHDMLARQTPWWVAFNRSETDVVQIAPEQLQRMSPAQLDQMVWEVQERAKTNYQFLYQFYPLIGAYFSDNRPKLPIFELFEFLNSPRSLQFFRALVGSDEVRWLDAQPTLYQPGHFLKSHSDLDPDNNRVAAYVLNFTRLWERDWGGYLQFYNARHDIEAALRPIFNALNIFLIPVDHSVGYVSPFATGARLSVTGWLRRDAPPKPIGGEQSG